MFCCPVQLVPQKLYEGIYDFLREGRRYEQIMPCAFQCEQLGMRNLLFDYGGSVLIIYYGISGTLQT